MEKAMLEALQILAQAGPHTTDEQLKNLGSGSVYFNAPASVLLRARKEWQSFKFPLSSVTTCSKVVARAEDLVKAVAGTKDYNAKFLAMCREIDNLRKSLTA
jgi:hypothetical protein